MRKIILSIALCNVLLVTAQNEKGIVGEVNWFKNWTNFKPKSTIYKESTILLSGEINKNTTLFKKDVYLLSGVVYVTNGATLNIEPGTLIRGDYESEGALVITKGSKIIALGSETDPIVFTSNKEASQRRAGDWGGLIILGEAPTNKFTGQLDLNLDPKHNAYGGFNDESDSGILNYVRIEFAGKKGRNSKAFNGLSLAGVGSKTILNNIQVSFSNDDSFECFGGNVYLKNLISFRAIDDDYDFTEGVQCSLNNSIAIRNPYISSSENPRCIEVETFDIASNADMSKKPTNLTATNITLLNEELDNTGLTREAVFVRENSFLSINNSVISGFNQAVLLDGKIKINFENLQKIKLQDMLFNNCNANIESEISEKNQQVSDWYKNDVFLIEFSKSNNIDFFVDADLKKMPDFRIKDNQMLTSRLANNNGKFNK